MRVKLRGMVLLSPPEPFKACGVQGPASSKDTTAPLIALHEVVCMITSLIGWIVFGLVVGGLARLLMPGRDPLGCLGTIVLGVAGSLIGGFLASLLVDRADGFQPASFLGSLIGAVLLLFLARQFRSRPPAA